MRNIKFTILLFILTAGVRLHAQTGMHIGVDGAFNGTFIINQNNYGHETGELEYAPTFGYTVGGSAGYNFNNHLGVQVEVKHSLQGQKYADIVRGVDVDRSVRLQYTHIPLLFKFSGGGHYATRFYLLAGPQFSFLNKAQETFSSSDQSVFRNYSENRTERFNRRDLQLVLDVGSDFVLYKNFYASTGLRFNYGLWDINADGFKIQNPGRTSSISQNALGGIHFGIHYVFGPPVPVKH